MSYPLETIVSWAKRKWFVYPGSDIYGGLANAWDYGPYWALLRKNIYDLIVKTFVQERDDIIFMDAALLMNPKVWEASWHVSTFNDPLIDDKNTWERFRADKMIEDYFENKNVYNELKDKLKNVNTDNDRKKIIWEYFGNGVWDVWFEIINLTPDSRNSELQHKFITTFIKNNPNSKSKADWTTIRRFSLMLSTQLWVIEWEWSKVRLRPETAQGIYVNFKNLKDTTRMRVPFWAIQIWKAFRNEITPGNFIFRTREFEQAEMQYFVEPWTSEKYFALFEELYRDFRVNKLGIKKENLRQRDHEKDELAFYASKARDFEYHFSRGWWELQWIHDRWDYDISNHQKHSGIDMQYSDPITGKRYIPHIVETALGLGRAMFVAMMDAYDEEEYTNSNWQKETRNVIRFNFNVAPIKYAIFPLIKKDDKQVETAKNIFKKLSAKYMCEYDDNGAIGKRYRRQDEIWTPFCITVDQQTAEDGTVTVRDRDSMQQTRVKIENIDQLMN